MPKLPVVEFEATILKREGMDNYYIPVPFDVEAAFGKKRLKVKIWYDQVLYRGLLAKYEGAYKLMLNKEVRAKLGKQAGEQVKVKITEDKDERRVEVPKEMEEFLGKEKSLKELFDKLSYTHQKEYVTWIASAKKEETLQNRFAKFKALLLAKQKN